MSRNVKELEEKIGYNFKDSHLLRHAVTHSSYVNEKHMKKADCNERLEFLGDAVLELISSEYLFFENQTMPEGELTKLRASMVCEKALAFCARDLELGSYLLLGKGEDATGVEVVIGGEAFGCGIGRTKKAAEQEAAYQAILKLKEGKVQ